MCEGYGARKKTFCTLQFCGIVSTISANLFHQWAQNRTPHELELTNKLTNEQIYFPRNDFSRDASLLGEKVSKNCTIRAAAVSFTRWASVMPINWRITGLPLRGAWQPYGLDSDTNNDDTEKWRFTKTRKQSTSKIDGSSGNAGFSNRKPGKCNHTRITPSKPTHPYNLWGTGDALSEPTLQAVSSIHFQVSLALLLCSTAWKKECPTRRETCPDSEHCTLQHKWTIPIQ